MIRGKENVVGEVEIGLDEDGSWSTCNELRERSKGPSRVSD